MTMQSPLGRVRGLGSAKSGAGTWFAERFTALALVPLTLWFVAVMISGLDADYAAMRASMAGPGNLALMVLLLGFAFWHMALGLVAVIEDYVHTEWVRMSAIVLVKFVSIAVAAACVFAVLKIAFAG